MKLSALLDRVHNELSDVPEPVALRALADSAKEFLTRTHAWQGSLPAVNLVEGQTTYTLAPDTGAAVVALKSVRLPGGGRVPPYPRELVDLVDMPVPAGAKPLGFIQRTPSVIELVNSANPQQITIMGAFTIIAGFTDAELPEDIMSDFGEAIAAGAKLRLVKQRGTPWFNPDTASLYASPFYTGVNDGKARAMTSMGEADMHVEMRRWV